MKAESGLRVVIDTNVWISAALKKTGVPARVVHMVFAQGQPVFSAQTHLELETRLWLPKFDRYAGLDERKAFLQDAGSLSYWVDVPPETASRTFCRDADDDMFIHAALAAEAPWLVTGDQDLLTVRKITGLRILSPIDALKMLEGRH
ncbi:MAG: putative toxin-antitoxin system toxin component, PIN family [Betaproteobacteria bacterium]